MQNQQPMNYQDDEIDLFELFQTLWQQKWLILTTTIVAPLLAYVFTVSKPVNPDVFQAKALIEIGTYATEMGELHQIERSQDLALIIGEQLGVTVSIPKTSMKLLEIQTSSVNQNEAETKLESAINFVISRHEKYAASQLKANVIQPTQVVGESKVIRVSPKDKLNLILAVAFVLGGMLGVFIALIRSAIRKRKLQTA